MACTKPEVGKFARAYIIGGVLTERDRSRFERHVLICFSCFQKCMKFRKQLRAELKEEKKRRP